MQKKFKVLVVEDDLSIREAVREILEMEGCEVEAAPEGQTALELLRVMNRIPDLIFLDLNMPRMSGNDFLIHQKHEARGIARIPIVVMTAVPGAHVDDVAAILRKPMEYDDIVAKLDEFRVKAAAIQLRGG